MHEPHQLSCRNKIFFLTNKIFVNDDGASFLKLNISHWRGLSLCIQWTLIVIKPDPGVDMAKKLDLGLHGLNQVNPKKILKN